MELTIYTANCSGVPGNCLYPNKKIVTSAAELAEAAVSDQVFAKYKDDYRSNANFEESCVIPLDIDNDHSEDPAQWLTISKLEEIFSDVEYAIIPSRNNMVSKNGKAARPKLHMLFPVKTYKEAAMYVAVKRTLQKKYPFFDDNATDAARFFFGSDCSEEDITWHDGFLQIDETLDEFDNLAEEFEDAEEDETIGGIIQEGSRNNTMSRFAGRVLMRYGNCDKAYQLFRQRAAQCDPPLPESELKTIWSSAVRFQEKVQSQDGYVPPDEYNDEFGGKGLRPDDYSDIGEAKVLVREYGSELKYTAATDYLRFDGDCWRENKQLAIGAVEEFLDLQLQDALDQVESAMQALISAGVDETAVRAGGKTLEKAVPEDLLGLMFALMGAQTYLKFVQKRRDYKYIISTSNTAKPMLQIEVSDLDKDEFLLNTPFCTYNLKLGVAGEQPHNPEDLITKMANCSPSDEGADIWADALGTFFCNDTELIEYVQKTVGLAAIGKVFQEQMIIAYGGGANGKSTFWNTVARVLGDYSGKVSAEALTMGCKRNVKPEMAELKGKRLIIASETEEGTRLNTGVVKQLSSTDEIQAEKKYKDPFKFTPSHLLVLYTNHLPKVGANDDGIWRRLIVIPFNAKIVGGSDIKNYADHLFQNAGGAIMKWIIEGAQMAIAEDFHFKLPKVVKDAIEAYRCNNDWLGQFLDDNCDVDPSYKEKSGDLYTAYRMYSVQNGEFVRSTTDFYGALEQAGFEKKKRKDGRFVLGLKLKDAQDFLE